MRSNFKTSLTRPLPLLLAMVFVPSPRAEVLLPNLASNLVCRYDFEHPVDSDPAREADLGWSGTAIHLVNGGADMRVADGAYPGSTQALQTRQVNPTTFGNDDWKAGVYEAGGLASISNFSAVAGISLLGWVKPTGDNPSPNSTTASSTDYYNGIGLFGVLAGTSEGHLVRALLEVVEVSGTLRLVALGRRIDGSSSLTLAATNEWPALLPNNTWTHLAATFDFDEGTMALYRNGVPLAATFSPGGDPWGVGGGVEPDLTSAAFPAGIKIGGSFPQNTQERNPFNGRFDDLMFFDRVLTPEEVAQQYASFVSPAAPELNGRLEGSLIQLTWPLQAGDFMLETETNLTASVWLPAGGDRSTNAEMISVTVPVAAAQQFFRLKYP